jgi:hypothetical protein
LKVFELIDLQQIGKVGYVDFMNVVEKSVTLPIAQIVRKRRIERGEAFIDGTQLLDTKLYPEEEERMRAYKSYQAEFSSTQPHNKKNIGSVDGLSQIMRRSEDEDPLHHRALIGDNDTLHVYSQLKEMLRINFNTFDDLLQKMTSTSSKRSLNQNPLLMGQGISQVNFSDFETLMRSMPQTSKFSTQQLKAVFMSYASGFSTEDAVIRTLDFKDKFFPGIHWKRNLGMPDINNDGRNSLRSFGGESSHSNQTESVHVDNILAGYRPEDKPKRDNMLSPGASGRFGAQSKII